MTLAEIVSICLSATALVLSIFQIAKNGMGKTRKVQINRRQHTNNKTAKHSWHYIEYYYY